jgi:hypothetical protein
MTWLIICWIAAIILILTSLKRKDFRFTVKPNSLITEIELLKSARLAFPTAENDIVAVDSYYSCIYRQMLEEIKLGHDIPDLKSKCLILFSLKNKLIADAVRFDERYIVPLNRKQTIIISTLN